MICRPVNCVTVFIKGFVVFFFTPLGFKTGNSDDSSSESIRKETETIFLFGISIFLVRYTSKILGTSLNGK